MTNTGDFPENTFTNVYRIDGLRFIQWSLYSLGHVKTSQDLSRDGSVLPASQRGEDGQITEHMRDIEFELRRNSKPVLYDADLLAIWAFDLYGASAAKGLESTRKEDISSLMDRLNMTKVSSGHLRASDLSSETGPPVTKAKTSKTPIVIKQEPLDYRHANTQAFGENAASSKMSTVLQIHDDTTTDGPFPQNPETMYSNFVKAIKSSLLYHASRSQDILPLGVSSFITTQNLQESFAAQDVGLGPYFAEVSQGSYQLQWFPSGTLTVSTCLEPVPGLYSLVKSPSSSGEEQEISRTCDIVLLPSGRKGKYCGNESSNSFGTSGSAEESHGQLGLHGQDRLFSARWNWKSSVMIFLRRHGLSVLQEDRWVEVEIRMFYESRKAGSLRSTRPSLVKVLWPARLCLYHANQVTCEEPNLTWVCGSSEDSKHDPLLSAEAWFKSKDIRNEAIETKKQKDEFDAEMRKKSLSLEDDETSPNSILHLDQYSVVQDVSGIYPTPPDALLTQGVGASMSSERHTVGGDFEASSMKHALEDDNGRTELASTTSPEMNFNLAQFGEQEDEDLFGDMDTEMFTANGLTEDDFNFFDEPDEDGIADSKNHDCETVLDEVPDEFKPDILPKDLSSVHRVIRGTKGDVSQSSGLERSNPDSTTEEPIKLEDVDSPLDVSPEIVQFLSPPSSPIKSKKGLHQIYAESATGNFESNVTPPNMADIPDPSRSDFRRGLFGSISFRGRALGVDRKYADEGRFDFHNNTKPVDSHRPNDKTTQKFSLPRTGLDPGRSNLKSVSRDRTEDLEADQTEEEDSSRGSSSPSPSSRSEATDETDLLISRKRKRGNGSDTGVAPTPSNLKSITNSPLISPVDEMALAVDLLSVETADIEMKECFSVQSKHSDSTLSPYSGSDAEFIEVAQILADQLVSPTRLLSNMTDLDENEGSSTIRQADDYGDALTHVLPNIFAHFKRCDLTSYTTSGEENPPNPPPSNHAVRSSQKRQSGSKISLTPKGNVFKLDVPYICVRRAEMTMDMRPAAIQFWEELGLGPSHGSKDVSACCIYPENNSIQRGVETFLTMVGSAYQSCKLGAHAPISDPDELINGLVPFRMGGSSLEDALSGLDAACEQFGQKLSKQSKRERNIVVYMINPFLDPNVLPRLCAAFSKAAETYMSSSELKNIHDPSILVLQIISLGLVASSTAIVLPPPAAYTRLAFEVYDRCSLFIRTGKEGSARSRAAPSVHLSKALPKAINFRLNPEPISGLLQADSCFHLSYSWEPGRQWLTASWTDNQGTKQWNASYCFGHATFKPWDAFSSIATEIWDTTLEMLHPNNTSWRLFLAKDSSFKKNEVDVWMALAARTKQAVLALSLIAVDVSPSLCFSSAQLIDSHPNSAAIASGLYTTPGSTPQASMLSPDQYGTVTPPGGIGQVNAPTPTSTAFDQDTDARLVDVTSETWGVSMAQALKHTNGQTSVYPALASGFIVKRAGPRDEDRLIAMGVDVVYAQRPYEGLLKDLLGMYGSLGTLARARGLVDPVRGVLPWHVAAARIPNKGLCGMMLYNGGS